MVEKVRGQEIRQEVVGMAKGVAEVAKELVKMAKKVIMVVEEVVEKTKQMEVVVESLTLLGNVRTINNGRGGCSYKEFMACNPKDYDGNVRDDNKRSRTGRAFAITTNPVRNMDHYKAACLRLNRAPRSGGNCPNKARVVEGGQGRGNNNVQIISLWNKILGLLELEWVKMGFSAYGSYTSSLAELELHLSGDELLRCDLKCMCMFRLFIEAMTNHKGDKELLFTSSLQRGDGGDCKVLGWLLGSVMEVLEVLDCLKMSQNERKGCQEWVFSGLELMDQWSWLWRKRSSKKIPTGETESLEDDLVFSTYPSLYVAYIIMSLANNCQVSLIA
ncbi:hypothetical protein Tco_0721297 [Tanacetum coccineum]